MVPRRKPMCTQQRSSIGFALVLQQDRNSSQRASLEMGKATEEKPTVLSPWLRNGNFIVLFEM